MSALIPKSLLNFVLFMLYLSNEPNSWYRDELLYAILSFL